MGRAIAAVGVLSLLAACGGGGGGGGSGNETPQADKVVITQSNAPSVAAEAINAAGAGADASGSLTAVEVSPSASESAMAALVSAVQRGVKIAAPNALVGVSATKTTACGTSGSITVSANVANANTVTPGDHVDLTFNTCVDSGVTTTGTLSVTFISGNSDLSLFTADATASSFAISVAGVGGRLNGTMRVSIDDTSSSTSVATITASSMSFDRLVNGTARATRTLSNYNYQLSTTVATGATAQTFSYTASGNFPHVGTVSFDAQTTQAIVTPSGAAHPTSGAGKVTGANGTSVSVTLTSTGANLAVDNTGDGNTDATLTLTWAELDAQL